jgi:hypothetical protein
MNPFSALYLTEGVRPADIPWLFSPMLVPYVSELFQPGNVVVRGMQGTGKSMLLALLETPVRQAFWQAEGRKQAHRGISVADPIPEACRRFVGAAINLSTSRATKLNEIVVRGESQSENLRLTQLYFGDYLNCWVLRDLINSLRVLINESPEQCRDAVGVTHDADRLSVALRKMADSAPCSMLRDEPNPDGAMRVLERRMRAYLNLLSNPRGGLSREIDNTRSLLGEPLTAAVDALRETGVIESDVHVFVTIDQFEALQRQAEHDGCDRRHGRFVEPVFELLSSRDPRVSYRIGTRPSAVIRSVDSARDYAEVNLDERLSRKEHGRKKWLFQHLAEDAFRRRLAVYGLPSLSDAVSASKTIRHVFGASPSNHDRGNKCASRKPERVIRCETTWHATICAAIESLVVDDPVAAKLAEAWVRQKLSGTEKLSVDAWKVVQDRPWEKPGKRWWKKERAAQVALQVASSNAQRLLFFGEEDILTLSGENILAFISICRSIWECDARHCAEQRLEPSRQKFEGFDELRQAQGIREASELWHRKIQQCADGDTLQRLMDVLGRRLNRQLIEDRSMSYPGANGISLAVEDLSTDDVIRKLLNDATAECLLIQLDHTPKDKSRGRSLKWYPHPLLAPYYGLTISRTKEPLYLKVRTLRKWLEDGQVIAVKDPESARAMQVSESSPGGHKIPDAGDTTASARRNGFDRQKTFHFFENHHD